MFLRQADGISDQGFTLVEVMVALVCLAIGLVLLWGLHLSSLKMDMSSQRRAQAIEIARRNLEWFRNPTNWTANPTCSAPLTGAADPSLYTCSVTFTTPAAATFQRNVQVVVTWNDRFQRKTGTSGTTLIPRVVRLTAVYIN